MFCWKENDILAENAQQVTSLEDVEGSPMSVQQAYTEMIGREDLTLERYQVRFFLEDAIQHGRLNCEWIGICIPETPGLRRYESQTTDPIIPDASAVPFASRRCSTKILDTSGTSSIQIHTFLYRHPLDSFLRLVETDQNQSPVGDKHELPFV